MPIPILLESRLPIMIDNLTVWRINHDGQSLALGMGYFFAAA